MPNDQSWNVAAPRLAQNISLLAAYVALAAPGISASAASSSSITISLTSPVTGATRYSLERSTDQQQWTVIDGFIQAGEFPYTDTGLAAETAYYYRAFASNETFDSSYSETVSDSTPVASTEDGYFSDDFESGDFSKTQTSGTQFWSWTPNSRVLINNALASDGLNSVRFRYGPDSVGADSSANLTFKFGKLLSEVWLEYDWYVPANYYHRDDGNSNNKLLQLSYNSTAFQALTIEADAPSGGTSMLKRTMSASDDPAGGNNWPTEDDDPYLGNFIGPGSSYTVKTGQWNQMRFHFRLSPDGVQNGLLEIWVNGSLLKQFAWPFWSSTYGGFINGGYLMGWSNAGYTEQTDFRVDKFKCYDTDPGWV